ncbi:MAG: hypothetical protein ACOCXP_00140 [Candidatus Dojkabacteria bacterium]
MATVAEGYNPRTAETRKARADYDKAAENFERVQALYNIWVAAAEKDLASGSSSTPKDVEVWIKAKSSGVSYDEVEAGRGKLSTEAERLQSLVEEEQQRIKEAIRAASYAKMASLISKAGEVGKGALKFNTLIKQCQEGVKVSQIRFESSTTNSNLSVPELAQLPVGAEDKVKERREESAVSSVKAKYKSQSKNPAYVDHGYNEMQRLYTEQLIDSQIADRITGVLKQDMHEAIKAKIVSEISKTPPKYQDAKQVYLTRVGKYPEGSEQEYEELIKRKQDELEGAQDKQIREEVSALLRFAKAPTNNGRVFDARRLIANVNNPETRRELETQVEGFIENQASQAAASISDGLANGTYADIDDGVAAEVQRVEGQLKPKDKQFVNTLRERVKELRSEEKADKDKENESKLSRNAGKFKQELQRGWLDGTKPIITLKDASRATHAYNNLDLTNLESELKKAIEADRTLPGDGESAIDIKAFEEQYLAELEKYIERQMRSGAADFDNLAKATSTVNKRATAKLIPTDKHSEYLQKVIEMDNALREGYINAAQKGIDKTQWDALAKYPGGKANAEAELRRAAAAETENVKSAKAEIEKIVRDKDEAFINTTASSAITIKKPELEAHLGSFLNWAEMELWVGGAPNNRLQTFAESLLNSTTSGETSADTFNAAASLEARLDQMATEMGTGGFLDGLPADIVADIKESIEDLKSDLESKRKIANMEGLDRYLQLAKKHGGKALILLMLLTGTGGALVLGAPAVAVPLLVGVVGTGGHSLFAVSKDWMQLGEVVRERRGKYRSAKAGVRAGLNEQYIEAIRQLHGDAVAANVEKKLNPRAAELASKFAKLEEDTYTSKIK